jgi:hypothetical protein
MTLQPLKHVGLPKNNIRLVTAVTDWLYAQYRIMFYNDKVKGQR